MVKIYLILDELIGDVIIEKNKQIQDSSLGYNPWIQNFDNLSGFFQKHRINLNNFKKILLIFLETNQSQYSNIIIYYPMKHSLFNSNSLLNVEQPAGEVFCLNFNDLLSKVTIF